MTCNPTAAHIPVVRVTAAGSNGTEPLYHLTFDGEPLDVTLTGEQVDMALRMCPVSVEDCREAKRDG